jgi:hypothetical protein
LIALIDWKISSLYQPYSFQKFSFANPARGGGGGGSSTDPSLSSHKTPLNVPDLTHFQSSVAAQIETNDDENMEIANESFSASGSQIQSQKIVSLSSFVHEISSMLFHLGHHLSASPGLLTKLCRLLKVRLESLDVSNLDVSTQTVVDLDSTESSDCELLNIYRITSCVILPSLSRIDCNPAVSALCWSIISLFPFNTRFTMYGIWKGDGLGKQVLFLLPVVDVDDSLSLCMSPRVSDQSHWRSSMLKRKLSRDPRLV